MFNATQYALIKVKEVMVSAGGGASIITAHDLKVVSHADAIQMSEYSQVSQQDCDGTIETRVELLEVAYGRKHGNYQDAIEMLVYEAQKLISPQQFDESRVRYYGDCSLPS